MAATTIGGAMKGQQEKQYAEAVNAANKQAFEVSRKAREDERARQGDMEQKMFASYDAAEGDLSRDNYDAKKDGAATSFVEKLDSMSPEIGTESRLAGQDGASVAVKSSINSQINKAAGDARERVKALANLQGYGRAGESRAASMSDASNSMSTIGGLRRGSLAASQQEQNIPAADVSRGSSTFADVLSGVGGAMSFAGPNAFKGVGGKLFPGKSIVSSGVAGQGIY